MTAKTRTKLKICVSEAKNHVQSNFDVKKSLAPPKPVKKRKKLFPRSNLKEKTFFVRAGCQRGDFFFVQGVVDVAIL